MKILTAKYINAAKTSILVTTDDGRTMSTPIGLTSIIHTEVSAFTGVIGDYVAPVVPVVPVVPVAPAAPVAVK